VCTATYNRVGRDTFVRERNSAMTRFFAFVGVLFIWFACSPDRMQAQQTSDRTASFDELVKKMSTEPGDACNGKGGDISRLEYYLFERSDEAVLKSLNETGGSGSPTGPVGSDAKSLAVRALLTLEQASAEINRDWGEEKRFHFEVLEIPPALIVKMTFRNRATFSFFGIPDISENQRSNKSLRAISVEDNGRFDPRSGYDSVELFPLQRSASNRTRFLAHFVDAGCGSGVGKSYYAYEWDPEDSGRLTEVIKLEGGASHENPVDGRHPAKKDLSSFFPPVGKLQTTGATIRLPFCSFTQIDTWDNPSLCFVDTYDISRDRARFVKRVTNRPDLVPIAKAIEYAQARDYPSLLAYCSSPKVAQKILRNVPPFVFAGTGLKVSPIRAGDERVEIGEEDEVLQFEVKKQAGRWVVARFQIQ